MWLHSLSLFAEKTLSSGHVRMVSYPTYTFPGQAFNQLVSQYSVFILSLLTDKWLKNVPYPEISLANS